jgi:hypothetical protein
MLGKTILQNQINVDKSVEPINVSNLSKGMYLINIKYAGQNNVKTFIKQ